MNLNTVTLATLLATAVTLVTPVRDAEAAAYTFSWSGSGGYSMSGGFSFDDALLGTGPITGAALALVARRRITGARRSARAAGRVPFSHRRSAGSVA